MSAARHGVSVAMSAGAADSEPAMSPSRAQDLLDTPDAGAAVIRGGGLRIVGYVVGVAVSVVSSALLLRHLGVVATGEYVTVVSLVTLAGGVTDAGLATIGLRELSTLTPEVARSFFRSLAGLRLVFIGCGGLCAVAFAALSGYSSTIVIGTLVAGGGLMLQTTQITYSLPLLAALRLRWVTVIELVRQLVTTLAIVVLVLLGAPLLPFWAATIPAGIAATALSAILIRRSMPLMPLTPSFDRVVWGPLVRRTLPYSMAAAVGVVYFRLTILIMSLVSNSRQTGYFGASFRVIEVVFVVPQLILASTFPIFARAARDDRVRLDYALGRMFDVCLLMGLATGLALITGAGFVIGVIAGPKFGPSDAVLRVQGLAMIATFVGSVFGYGLLSLERYREVLSINLAVLILSGVLTSLLAASDGALGAATATMIVELLYTAMLSAAILRAGARPQVSVAAIPRALLAALLGALALLPPDLPDLARPLLALTVYAAALLLLRAVPREIIEQLPRFHRMKPTL
jgi:O-antigen/teichoic acid export membrane protein